MNTVFGDLQNSQACIEASELLIRNQSTVYFSQVLRIEFAQAVRRLVTRQQLTDELFQRFELKHWTSASIRHRWLAYGIGQLNQYLALLPRAVELRLARPILDRSVYVMAEYSLQSLDAVHAATALHYQIPTFWTCDDHSNRIDDMCVEVIRS